MNFIDTFLHIDTYLAGLTSDYGVYIYALLFLVIFLETGIVATPFLPGDSLLFAAGAIAASAGGLNIWILLAVIASASIIGDSVNYTIGSYLGARAFGDPNSQIFKKEYLDRAQEFYSKYGDRAVVLGRFFPIIRTFVPFVAGVSNMKYDKFVFFNITGGILWTLVFCFGGYLFGNIQIVKDNFTAVIFGIIIISLLPGIYHLFANRLRIRE
ncbi:MAG: DedA family protein [bacterium]|nr:DedA family protein [bacterium]